MERGNGGRTGYYGPIELVPGYNCLCVQYLKMLQTVLISRSTLNFGKIGECFFRGD